MRYLSLPFIVLLSCLVLQGCGNNPLPRPEGVAVRGRVLLPNQKPLGGGTLILTPESGLHAGRSLIQTDGSFALEDSAGNQDVVPGKYRVFVTFPNQSQSRLAAAVNKRYQDCDEDMSDLTVEIQSSTDDLVIRLNR
jgi:hypothetical protein